MRENINGVEINYIREGTGAPVLILHGWGANIAAVKPITDTVKALGYEAIALDFPGFGETAEPPCAWGVREYADMTKAFIEKLGIRGADVICHSFGGRVVIMLASEDRTLFHRLVLVDAAGIRDKRGLRYYIRTYSYKLMKRLARIKVIDRLFHISEKQAKAGSEDYRALSSDIMRKTFINVVNLDLASRLKDIENETLIIWGEHDDVTPMHKAERMNREIRDSGLAIIKGGGHFSYADNIAQFSAIMKAFFGSKENVSGDK